MQFVVGFMRLKIALFNLAARPAATTLNVDQGELAQPIMTLYKPECCLLRVHGVTLILATCVTIHVADRAKVQCDTGTKVISSPSEMHDKG